MDGMQRSLGDQYQYVEGALLPICSRTPDLDLRSSPHSSQTYEQPTKMRNVQTGKVRINYDHEVAYLQNSS